MMRALEVGAWMCICAGLIALRVYPEFVPVLGNDSFQYFSIAGNALAGQFGYTSIVHFDVERSFGVIPAPVVTFPMGYPLAIAAFALPGLSMESAALLISAGATIACIPLIWWISQQVALKRGLSNLVLAAYVLNGTVVFYGSAAVGEAPFTFLVLLGVAFLASGRTNPGWWRWAAAGLAFGAAYHVRYAGLFFVVALALLAVRYLISRNRSLLRGHALALVIACVVVLPGIARNIVLVGDWRGGNEKIISNPVSPTLVETARAANGLFLGPGLLRETLPFRALFAALFIAAMGWLAWSYVRGRKAQEVHHTAEPIGIGPDLTLVVMTYGACMFYAGLTTVISYGTRMFVPLVPLLLLLVGIALQAMLARAPPDDRSRKAAMIALGASFCVYVYLNMLVFRLPEPSLVSPAHDLMDEASSTGKAAREAILALTSPRGLVVANNGQAVGYVIQRPTVSLVGPSFSNIEWNAEAVYETVQRFKAAAIVIYVPAAEQWKDDDLIPSEFVRSLALGAPPPWMTLVYRSGRILIYSPRQTAANPEALDRKAARAPSAL